MNREEDAMASKVTLVSPDEVRVINNYWTSHLGGGGEPSGATRRPRGRPWQPPECPNPAMRWTAPSTIPGGGRGLIKAI